MITEKSLPLYVGKKWEKTVSGVDTRSIQRNYLYGYRVLSFEDVTVLAGTFKAFKIEREQEDDFLLNFRVDSF